MLGIRGAHLPAGQQAVLRQCFDLRRSGLRTREFTDKDLEEDVFAESGRPVSATASARAPAAAPRQATKSPATPAAAGEDIGSWSDSE